MTKESPLKVVCSCSLGLYCLSCYLVLVLILGRTEVVCGLTIAISQNTKTCLS